jgi:spore maturation protein CgeB
MPHVRAFQKLGFECRAFNNRAGKIYSSQMLRRFMRVFPKLRIIKKITLDRTNQRLISLVKEYKPSLLFGIKAENIYPETIEEIKKTGAKTVLFFIDFMDNWDVIKKLAPAYDYFFSQDRVVLRRLWGELNLKNSFYMAHSAEPIADPFLSRINKYEISFIGQYGPSYPNREKYLLAIKEMGLNIWGTDSWKKTLLKDCFRGRSRGDQRFDIYSQSKIVVDINWNIMPVEGLSNRPFEVMGSGACFFIDLMREDIKRCYEEGKEFVAFRDENDLREKIKYHLEHEDEREKIARAGYAKTVAKHTYNDRIKLLFDVMKDPDRYLYK